MFLGVGGGDVPGKFRDLGVLGLGPKIITNTVDGINPALPIIRNVP